MKTTPVLDMYYDFCKNGIPNNNGLCQHFQPIFEGRGSFASEEFKLLMPSEVEFNIEIPAYWGNEAGGTCLGWQQGQMTPLRQNIVLFIAAIRGEL